MERVQKTLPHVEADPTLASQLLAMLHSLEARPIGESWHAKPLSCIGERRPRRRSTTEALCYG